MLTMFWNIERAMTIKTIGERRKKKFDNILNNFINLIM